jgi:hypothetical protein
MVFTVMYNYWDDTDLKIATDNIDQAIKEFLSGDYLCNELGVWENGKKVFYVYYNYDKKLSVIYESEQNYATTGMFELIKRKIEYLS